jgi:hypothetical protein
LELIYSAVVRCGAETDYQLATPILVLALHQMPNWPEGINDGWACGLVMKP